jgi:hypothetical protein
LHVDYWDPHNDYFEPKERVERAAEAGPPGTTLGVVARARRGSGSTPDPMQTTLDVGPTFQFDPAEYIEHLRNTARKDLAVDLEQRLGGS